MSTHRIDEFTGDPLQLKAWDAGDIVWTIELGGMGPGYEQAIQLLVFELLREGSASDGAVERAMSRIEDGGYSGAQVGAARSLAVAVLERGWPQIFLEAGSDRKIMTDSRHLPRLKAVRP